MKENKEGERGGGGSYMSDRNKLSDPRLIEAEQSGLGQTHRKA